MTARGTQFALYRAASSTNLFSIISSVLLLVSTGCASRRAIYVSATGDDRWTGTKRMPVRSLEAAREIARNKKSAATVWLRGGIYLRTATFELNERDSSVEYRAFPGEEVILCGGREVRGFTAVTDESVLKRLDPAARGKVLVADLKSQ